MLESVIVSVIGFGNAVAAGTPGDVERRAEVMLGELDELAQGSGDDDAFKRALLQKAGFLVAIAQARGDEGLWLEAFRVGLRQAAEMLGPVPMTAQGVGPTPLDA